MKPYKAKWCNPQKYLGLWVINPYTILVQMIFGSYISLTCTPPIDAVLILSWTIIMTMLHILYSESKSYKNTQLDYSYTAESNNSPILLCYYIQFHVNNSNKTLLLNYCLYYCKDITNAKHDHIIVFKNKLYICFRF